MRYWIWAVIALVVMALGWILLNNMDNDTPEQQPEQQSAADSKTLQTNNIDRADSGFAFSVTVPAEWKAESIPAIKALNFYDPSATGGNALDKSQIFVRQFTANTFLTLSSVAIHSRTEQTINNRSAVRYDIEKKPGISDFPHQPGWRNDRHIVTDIRTSNDNPAIFYVIAKRPSLSEDVYQDFLNSLELL